MRIMDLNISFFNSGNIDASLWQKEGFNRWASQEFCKQVWYKCLPHIEEQSINVGSISEWDVIGIHVNGASKHMAGSLTKYFREKNPNVLIAVGGPEYFSMNNNLSDLSHFDAVFQGEAEESFTTWLSNVENKKNHSLHKSNKIIGKQMKHISNLPIPSYDDFPLQQYVRKGVYPMETTRGCINHCSFCDNARMWKTFRMKNCHRIRKELINLSSIGAGCISFCDTLLNPSAKRFGDFLNIISEFHFRWDGMIQAKYIDKNIAKTMYKSGCSHIFIGVESFTPSFLKHMNKEKPSINSESVIRILSENGINISIGIIVAAPPFQSDEEFENDLQILKRLAPFLRTIAVSPLCIPKGTPLWCKRNIYGLKGLESSQGWRFWYTNNRLQDLEIRLLRCKRMINQLQQDKINYSNFDEYIKNEMKEAGEFPEI